MDEPVAESVWGQFDNTWLKNCAGLSFEAAVAKARADGRPMRVVRPDSEVTLDLRPDRLNLHVDAAGRLQELSAG